MGPGEVGSMHTLEMKFEQAMKTSEGLGSEPPRSDVEPLKYGYRIGLETLVVHTLNQWVLYFR